MNIDPMSPNYDTILSDSPKIVRLRGSLESFKRAMTRYRPEPLRLLFIAEAPPAYKVNRLFYFHDIKTGDALFLEMMKVIYGAFIGFSETEGFLKPMSVKDVRGRKPELLKRFVSDGYFLIDASERPMPDGATASAKLALLCQSLPGLKIRVKALLEEQRVPIVLIGGVTHDACFGPLKDEGYNVINEEMINHPARGGQLLFRKKLRATLNHIARTQSTPLKRGSGRTVQ
jgi:hypothetical protein